jgi:hypothetical protein
VDSQDVWLQVVSVTEAGGYYGFEDYVVAEVAFMSNRGLKKGVRLCRKPGEVACLVGTIEYPDVEAAVAAIAAEAHQAAE